MPIELDSEVLADFERAQRLEWLETNGKGGFASTTVLGANTRRYHGLLTAALTPPVRRHVLVSRLEEVIEAEGKAVELGCNFYRGTVHPTGHQYLSSFRLDPFPMSTYWVGERGLEKAVFMVHGEDTVVVRYTLFAGPGCFLQVRPFLAFRDYHSLTHRNDVLDRRVGRRDGTASVRPYGDLPMLHFHHDARELLAQGDWWMRHQYPREAERGFDCEEDLFSPFALRFELSTGSSVFVVASLDRSSRPDAAALERAERRRRREVVDAVRRRAPGLDERLALAADAFVVDRFGAGSTVIAGYPWFTDWGRDTMVSLPGLCLATGRLAEARDILQTFARSIDRGMIANVFPDGGQAPEYNNVDGTLWFVRACGAVRGRERRPQTPPGTCSCQRSATSSAITAPARATVFESTPTVCCGRAQRASRSPGWMPRSAAVRSRPGPASRWRCRRCGSTRSTPRRISRASSVMTSGFANASS